ncbi:MAG: LPS export ABC transporter ATP-binding protein [Halieaceae bacterium MED-G27]|nr:LPS export ABC transporter ATP-binding protein [Halieaceae bacterium]OUT65714.1 MAG: LPS export ABC transporter ATP-binding protein [Cellvibrionales bacterium TMED21]PDH35716.1 MAG: LPS export ABC transporter ATP-binding protein [Halieaceae bacterium MED-G27]
MSRRLEANDLTKSYRGRRVVDGISLAVEQGEIVGLLGPNGAGKTTSFYLIVGLVSADSGSISIDSQNITSLPIHHRAQQGLGYLPQEASVFRQLSVKDNLMAILETQKDLSAPEQMERCDTLLREFHITHLADALGQALSGGERRRVEIARALATEPDFILLDEPFAGVDPISIADIKGIISHLKDRGIGVLITDHNVRETLDICERAYIVNAGKVIAEGDAKAVMENAEVRKVYLGENFRL